MGVIVQFNYERWLARYPEFSQVAQPTAQEYFGEATLYLRNDGTGPVRDAETQLRLLNMLTAHIAALNAPSADGEPASPLVGRINNASEGIGLGADGERLSAGLRPVVSTDALR